MKKTILNTLIPAFTLLVLFSTSAISFANNLDYPTTLNNPVVLDSIVKIDPTCGLDNGSIMIFASGSPHIFYSIDNGITFHEEYTFHDMALGDYSIVVTDGLASVINTTLQLTNGPQVEISNVEIACHEQNVSADILVEVDFGITPYFYNWEGPSNFTSSQENLFGVTPGEYRLTITDNVGCTAIDTIQIPICCGLSQGLELNCPGDLFLECGNPNNDQLINNWLNSATAYDGVNNVLVVENNYNLSSDEFCEDIVTIRFRTTDQCGNTTDCDANILIADINLPTLNCPGDITLDYDITGSNQSIQDWLDSATASDNCSGARVENDFDTNNIFIDCLNGSTIEVVFTALDNCENTDMCTATLTVNPAPLVNLGCNNTLSLSCDSADPDQEIQKWIDEIVALDDYGNKLPVENNFIFQNNYECGDQYEILFTASNYCGSVLTCNARIQVVDYEAPVINCDDHLNISAYANNKPELIEEWLESIQATDNCSETELTHNFNPSSLNYACGAAESKVVRFDAIDECGNTQVCLLSLNIIASEITIETPAPIELDCGINSDVEIAVWLSQAKAKDQFGFEVELENNFDPSNLSCSTEVVVTFIYQNPCGESLESSSTIRLSDNTGPEIQCPEAISLKSFEIPSFDFDAWINEFTATDLCSDVFLYNDFDYQNFNGSCIENQVVHFVAEDDCGNISECIVDVRISDFAPPEIMCPGDISLDTYNRFAKEDLDAHLASIVTNTNSTVSFEYSEVIDFENLQLVFENKTIDVEATATNECDEFVTCSFKIHINSEADIFAPTIFTPNGDEDNDRFTIYGNNHLNTIIKLAIYDRLGNRMEFLTNIPINSPSVGWDGTFHGRDCEVGVYAYHALIQDYQGNEIEFTGSITLIR